MKEKVVVLGGGIGGLAAGYFLSRTGKFQVTVLEEASYLGGLCGSFAHDGFVLDYGAHKVYSVIPGILKEIRDLMGDRLVRLPKKHRFYLQGHLLDYPLRFGNLAGALGGRVSLRLGLGYARQLLGGIFDSHPIRSYEEYMVKSFGRPAYALIFEPLAEKVWGSPAELHTEIARARFPTANGLAVILKLAGLKRETAETNADFFYYPRRGFGDLPQALAEQIEKRGGRVLLNVKIEELERQNEKIVAVRAEIGQQAERFSCDYLISSIALRSLGQLIFQERNPELKRALQSLEFRHLILVYLFINRPSALEDQWIFFPERKFAFSRIFEQKQMNPELGPPDRTAICCDIICAEDNGYWQAPDEEVGRVCENQLVGCGIIKAQEVTGYLINRKPYFYPRYDLLYDQKMQTISAQLKGVKNLLLTGRIGMYNYNNSDHCADMGHFIAERLAKQVPTRQIWDELEQRISTYRIVD